LDEQSAVKQYLITAADGKNYQTKHYSLQAIIAVGFKIENERAVQFAEVGQSDCEGLHHPGLDDGCAAPEKGWHPHR
jgi:hypothetical protein